MRIAIAMRTYEADAPAANTSQSAPGECFAEFEVDERRQPPAGAPTNDEMVQVTVVLRGKRGELEDPALSMTELVLRALQARTDDGPPDVIDAMGIAIEPAYAS
jgi:hypothetical protein